MLLTDDEDTYLITYLTELSYDVNGVDNLDFIYYMYKQIHDELVYIVRIPNMSLLFLYRSLTYFKELDILSSD